MAKIYVNKVKPTSLSAKLAALLREQGFEIEYFICTTQHTVDYPAWEAFSDSRYVLSVDSMKDCVENGITIVNGFNEVNALNCITPWHHNWHTYRDQIPKTSPYYHYTQAKTAGDDV